MAAIALKEEQKTLPGIADGDAMLEIIARAARDPSTDVDKLERLMAMSERVNAARAKQAFGVAMRAAQEEMDPVRADCNNPQTKSKYASYGALDGAIRPIYTKHGFALTFDTGEGAPVDYVRVVCEVFHEAGHTRTYHWDMPADGKGAKGGDVMTKTHAAGSAGSYGQRYLLKFIFNIVVGEYGDDDGNAASGDGPISADERAELQVLMDQANADPEKFCKYMKVGALAEITKKNLGRAREALNLAINDRQRKASK